MYFVVGFLIGSSVAFIIGFVLRDIKDTMSKLIPEETSSPAVTTPLPPEHIRENASIVTPKTPAQIAYEERERVKEL